LHNFELKLDILEGYFIDFLRFVSYLKFDL
jgi:hypothetical protein